MDPIDQVLARAEAAVAAGEPLGPTGFWRAVAAVKTDPDRHRGRIDRIAAIDHAAFQASALLTIPLRVGTALMVVGTITGLALVAWAYYLSGTASALAVLAGTAVVLVTTHGLAHLVVGRLVGIRFTHWFVKGITRPQPGVKLDYASYLSTPASARAWMHASGAIVSKLIPFLMLGAAVAAGVPRWAVWVLLGLGLVQLATDLFISTRASDWKKFRRERRYRDR